MNVRPSLRIAASVAMTFAGCVSVTPPWIPAETGSFHPPGQQASFTAPVGWMRASKIGPDGIIYTRDGILLQCITVERRLLDKALPHSKLPLQSTMLALEAADAYVANLQASGACPDLGIVDLQPADVGGASGFRLEYTFLADGSIRMGNVVYGVVRADGLHLLRYRAPIRHYFAANLADFEQLAASYQLH
jgi:hypothetical protein